jgi:paraquat-inducible protein A
VSSLKSAKAPIQKLSHRNRIAFLFSLISFLFLFPGIYLSMLSVSTKGSVNTNVPHVEHNFLGIPSINGTEKKHISLNILDTTRSILKTIHDLWGRDYYFVAGMILLFSVIIPFIKGGLVTYIFFTKDINRRKKIFEFIKAIGKWSMCLLWLFFSLIFQRVPLVPKVLRI